MNRYINCIVHQTSCGNLLIGGDSAGLFDCGMLFCAEETIAKVKRHLAGRPLDYIFASHTHYDHIGALPAFRAQWPLLKLVTCAVGEAILLKDTPRRVIRELSVTAAERFAPGIEVPDYDDDAFHADVAVKEGDAISLGGLTVEVVETPGHTRDSLSWFIRELGLLILSETTGVLKPDGKLYTSYLTGFGDTMRSIEKCRNVTYKHLSLPHMGIISPERAESFFDRAARTAAECRDFILELYRGGAGEDAIVERYADKYADKTLAKMQPMEAFWINAKATVACTLREFPADNNSTGR